MALYKVLVNKQSCNKGTMVWKLNKLYTVDGDVEMCKNGIHLTTQPYDKWYQYGCRVYEAESDTIISWRGDKCVCTSAKLTNVLPLEPWEENVIAFIDSLPDILWLSKNEDPLPGWHMTTGYTWDEAMNNCINDCMAAALSDPSAAWNSSFNSARALAETTSHSLSRTAAFSSVYDAGMFYAREALWNYTENISVSAGWNAAMAAALYAGCLVAELPPDNPSVLYAIARMNVWRMGYATFCDLGGVLYVYSMIPRPAIPEITVEPIDVSVDEGSPATFSITVTGENVLYQWEKSIDSGLTYIPISDATSATYTTLETDYTTDNLNLFQCRASNDGGVVMSFPVTLTVVPVAPTIVTDPHGTTVARWNLATFTVVAAGNDLSYQWEKKPWGLGTVYSDIIGATYSTCSFYVLYEDNDSTIRCKVSNPGGTITSNFAILTVT